MIEGEAGTYTLDKLVELREDVDGDTISCTAIAAIYADALRKGCAPRDVLNDLKESLPEADAWEGWVREQMVEAIDLKEAA